MTKAMSKIHHARKDRGHRQDEAREVDLRHHVVVRHERAAALIERDDEQAPRQQGGERKDGIGNAFGREFCNAVKQEGEDQHGHHRLNDRPCHAEQRLFVFHFHIAPDHEEDQFTVDPKVAQVQCGKTRGRFDVNGVRFVGSWSLVSSVIYT
jgi:hypothetical protein